MISLDTETTGVDLHHGAKPYLVTTYNGKENLYWEWFVDPVTREPEVSGKDISEIIEQLELASMQEGDESNIILQNPKFDVQALDTVMPVGFSWNWRYTRDTLLAGHLLASNQPHDLTTMVLIYLGVNVQPYEEEVEKLCKEARKYAKKKYPHWRLAKPGLAEMPSAKGKDAKKRAKGEDKDAVWKYDMWLLRAIAREENYSDDHPYWHACANYANTDSASTWHLYQVMMEEIKKQGLEEIYELRLKLLPIVYLMEKRGITYNEKRLRELYATYKEESELANTKCVNIASRYGYDLQLPKSGNNNSLMHFCFGRDDETWLDLPILEKTDSGAPSLNKKAMDTYEATLPRRSPQLFFVRNLRNKRKRDTAITYMEGYEKYALPYRDHKNRIRRHWKLLHPSLNPTGTGTLRWSSNNPNQQNISKQEGFNLRYCFGPAPGREWWSLDAKNIELRLPAYEANETEMIALFERPDDPPYYGSYHLLVFDTLHPEKFAKHGTKCKEIFESTWYQWTKNGNFAVQYGAIESSGTADAAYHIEGAQRKIQDRFSNIKDLNNYWIDFAERNGFVETIPDKSLDCTRGYPLYCSRTSWGKILPTVPFNYHIQGSAMWWMMKAMIRCQEFLDKRNSDVPIEEHAYMIMQVHDELVFDFPADSHEFNVEDVREIQRLMSLGGRDFGGIPTPVSMKYHAVSWDLGT